MHTCPGCNRFPQMHLVITFCHVDMNKPDFSTNMSLRSYQKRLKFLWFFRIVWFWYLRICKKWWPIITMIRRKDLTVSSHSLKNAVQIFWFSRWADLIFKKTTFTNDAHWYKIKCVGAGKFEIMKNKSKLLQTWEP